MGKGKAQKLPTLDTTMNGSTAEGPGRELADVGDYVTKLKQVAVGTRALVGLLCGRLQELIVTVTVLRGFEIVCAQLRLIVLVLLSRAVGRRTEEAFERAFRRRAKRVWATAGPHRAGDRVLLCQE